MSRCVSVLPLLLPAAILRDSIVTLRTLKPNRPSRLAVRELGHSLGPDPVWSRTRSSIAFLNLAFLIRLCLSLHVTGLVPRIWEGSKI
ncbi:hypothetical protein B0T25DRAFT_72292 [Lasiosphaeria hispida]|uniref:Uncharacterized protein n=1 Tax=Lasiosphaeria hispida TaxID=260671 RepID=A0AAJ0H4X1_9PEZI|nr:hypothetical protein B0T25DRAFT_72292 [Lasiosphaeria hispida]